LGRGDNRIAGFRSQTGGARRIMPLNPTGAQPTVAKSTKWDNSEMQSWEFGMPIITAICAGGAAYFGAYLRKKGENLATHEDLSSLVKQVEAVTQTTKTIEYAISNDVWDRQKRWEMKRDTLMAAVDALGRAREDLMKLIAAFKFAERKGPQFAEETTKNKIECANAFNDSIDQFDEKRHIAMLVCKKSTLEALAKSSKEIRLHGSALFKGKIGDVGGVALPVNECVVASLKAARVELGIEDAGEVYDPPFPWAPEMRRHAGNGDVV
jgi:tRNA-dihydrouridine synthase